MWTKAAVAALTATVIRVTRLRPNPAMSPMKRAVKAKSAPSRSGLPRSVPSTAPIVDEPTQPTGSTAAIANQ